MAVMVLGMWMVNSAWALTMRSVVTPESVKQDPTQIEVRAEKRPDGLVHFTITLHLKQKQAYLVARTRVRDGEKTVLDSSTPSYVREESATYHVAVAADWMGDTTFDVFSGFFEMQDGKYPVPMVGGTEYEFDLGAFAKTATEVKDPNRL